MPAAEQGRFSTPVSSKHHKNAKENTLTNQDEADLEGPSPPPLAAPLSDDTLDASSPAEKQQPAAAAADRPVPAGRSESPFAATPSPIGNRTLSNSEDIANDDTIDGTFDTGNNYSINISEIDESASLFLNNNTASANGDASAAFSSRRNSTSNDTTLKSILELSEIDTTFDGAALNRTIGATDASPSASASLSASPYHHRPPRDLSEIDTTMDAGIAGSTSSTGNANSIEESKLQAELAVDASERMQRMVEEATSAGSGADGGEDENSTLAGQAFVGGGSGASVITSGGSMASYSVGGNTVATAGTDIADFLRKQNEAMQRALAGAGVGADTIISPTKTRAVDAAVENARIMAEATAKLTPGNGGGANVTAESPSSDVKRNSSMEFGSQSHLNVGATGKFTTDDASGAVTVQSVKTNTSGGDTAGATSKSTPNPKSVRSKATSSSSSSSTYQSQYALSPSQRAKESMTVAEKIRQAEAEAMARDGGPTFEKMAAVNETDDDYVPIADFSSSAKKNKKKQVHVQAVGSFDYNDYSPDNLMGSPEYSAVQRYRIMMRRKKRRKQRRMIRATLVAIVIGAFLFWWYRGGSNGEAANQDSGLEREGAMSAVEEDGGIERSDHAADDVDVSEADEELFAVDHNGEHVVETEEVDVADAPTIDNKSHSDDTILDHEADSSSLASVFAREKIQLINTSHAPIVKLFIAAKAGISRIEPRTIPFSHFWNEDVRNKAKTNPILAGIDELLESMMQ